MGAYLWIIFAACIGASWAKFANWNEWSICTSACTSGVSRRERLLPPGSGEYCHSVIIKERTCSGTRCRGMTLISQGRGTRASSNLFGIYPSKHAVDGNLNSRLSAKSCMHTEKEKNPWLMIDLGNEKIVQKVFLYNRGDCCSDRLNNAYVTVGNNESGRGNAVCGRVGDVTDVHENKINCATRLSGRYVHVRVDGPQFLVLCEVRVYGSDRSEVSRGVSTSMSPAYSSDYPSYKAVDGKTNTRAHTKPGLKDPYFAINFGTPRYISSITVHACGNIFGPATITVGNSKAVTDNEICGIIEQTKALSSVTIRCPRVLEGQYVNMTVAGTIYICLSEFQAFGY